MKFVLIIIVILVVALRIFKNTKIYRETELLLKIRKNINNNSPAGWLQLNMIRSEAAELLFRNKISREFYKKIFSGGDAKNPWWEVNRENIMS